MLMLMLPVCFRHVHRMPACLALQELYMDVNPSGLMHLSYVISVNFGVHGLLNCVLGLARAFKITHLFRSS